MNETRRKPTTGRQPPSLFDKWHGILVYMPSRIDEAGHTKAFDYPVGEHWGESQNVQFRGWDPNQQRNQPGIERATNWATPVPPEDHITPGPQQGGIFSHMGGQSVRISPATWKLVKAIPMGPEGGWRCHDPTLLAEGGWRWHDPTLLAEGGWRWHDPTLLAEGGWRCHDPTLLAEGGWRCHDPTLLAEGGWRWHDPTLLAEGTGGWRCHDPTLLAGFISGHGILFWLKLATVWGRPTIPIYYLDIYSYLD